MDILIFLIFVAIVIAVLMRRSAPPPNTRRDPPSRSVSSDRPVVRVEAQRSTSFDQSRQPPSDAQAARESSTRWWLPGRAAVVAGREIASGMLYVGTGMRALTGYAPDPALINPDLPVAKTAIDTEDISLPYWPSYSDISPEARRVYLDWLAGGMTDPNVPIGMVFLFFYGIERRVLVDAPRLTEAREEVPVLLAAVERLRGIYGSNNSFRQYATGFIDIVGAAAETAEATTPEAPTTKQGWEVPIGVKLAVGRSVAEGRPIPAEWAFAWLLHHPESYLRTPAERCPEEFRELFLIRYRETYGEGLVLKPNKSKLTVTYRPASGSFRGPVTIDLDLPDVTRLTGPLNRLKKIADEAQNALDRYSRWVGRNEDRTSPAALALLPSELLCTRIDINGEGLLPWAHRALSGSGVGVVEVSALVERWPAKDPGKLAKAEARALAELLAAGGIGMEPDVRFGGQNPTRVARVVLFRTDGLDTTPSRAFAGASALLHLGAAIATADDEITVDEERHLEQRLEEGLGIGDGEKLRLRAHLAWLLSTPPKLSSLRKSLEHLQEEDRHRVGRFLLGLAGADGTVSPAEIKLLSKIYPLLGLDPDDLYSDIHALSTGSDPGPVTVLPADPDATDFAVRPRPAGAPGNRPGGEVRLDMDRIKGIQGQSAEVSGVLGAIFSDTDAEPTDEDLAVDPAEDAASPPGVAMDADRLMGLDVKHSALLRALMAQEWWRRAEFDGLARSHGLMGAGAIEIINEASFAICDEPMIEGDDPLEINRFALEELG